MKHKHHILPKHMGGTDDATNLVELTIEEHAEAHRELFDQHGKFEDLLAYLALTKLIGKEQLLLEKSRLGGLNNRGKPKSIEHKIKISKNAAGGVSQHTIRTKEIMSNKSKGNKNSRNHNTQEYKTTQSAAMKLA